jgi:hypothetical protein
MKSRRKQRKTQGIGKKARRLERLVIFFDASFVQVRCSLLSFLKLYSFIDPWKGKINRA